LKSDQKWPAQNLPWPILIFFIYAHPKFILTAGGFIARGCFTTSKNRRKKQWSRISPSWIVGQERVPKTVDDVMVHISVSTPPWCETQTSNPSGSELERAFEQHGSCAVLRPIANLITPNRSTSLEKDISFLLQVPQSSWKSHSIYKRLLSSPPRSLSEYIARIQALADSSDPSPLLAHAYVRYIGDLCGGAYIRGTVAKAYGLDVASTSGLMFFDYGAPKENMKYDTLDRLEKLILLLEDGINAGVGDNQDLKGIVTYDCFSDAQ
jgi:hypothetical protein